MEILKGTKQKLLEDKLKMEIKVKIGNIYETKLNTTCTNTYEKLKLYMKLNNNLITNCLIIFPKSGLVSPVDCPHHFTKC